MNELRGKHSIQALQKRWTSTLVLAHLLLSLAITVLEAAILIKLFNTTWLIAPIVFVITTLLVFLLSYRKITERDVATFLNSVSPGLEESATLVLKPYESLTFFERLQLQKVERSLTDNIHAPKALEKKLKSSLLSLLISLVICLLFYLIPFRTDLNFLNNISNNRSSNSVKPETKLPEVDEVELKIIPPAYTGKGVREQRRFNIVSEEGAIVKWRISTTVKAKEVALLFNDKSRLQLQPGNTKNTLWLTNKHIKASGFYQLKIDNHLSELYKIEMIKDQPPVIVVQAPKPNTLIEPGQAKRTNINVTLTDDYGIKNTFISVTIASGSGEAVKFQEQEFRFPNFNSGSKKYQLQKQVDLASLGMKPGDELYFYITATDTYNQEKRSDAYIVRIEDTTNLMSMEGLVSGINIKPEFFRSQRQIIIETEQLLRARDTISVEEFKKRSNELGVDQKLLRLRYGKFLGEETDVEIGEGHDHDEEAHDDSHNFGKAEKILEEYSHKHDNAEDATFFDAQTKKQLKATLTEMWKAELQLRTIRPKDALPFEYNALKLLKDLQQQTRVYVAKTGVKTTPLKPEKRLTGELKDITQPVLQSNYRQQGDPSTTLRKALGVLEQVRTKETLERASVEILEQASIQLSARAAAEPSAYLKAYEALRRALNNKYKAKDIDLAGNAFQRMLKHSSKLPQRSTTNPGMQLSQQYFMNLNKRND